MKLNSIEQIIQSLNKAEVQYLIAGGLAVTAHGYLRFTADLDLIIHFDKTNILKAVTVFKDLGYKPRAPVPIETFADEKMRLSWISEKNLKVFSLWSQVHEATEIDVFVEEPLDFQKAYQRKSLFALSPKTKAPVLSLEDLISLKKRAGRKKDLDDIEQLQMIQKAKENE